MSKRRRTKWNNNKIIQELLLVSDRLGKSPNAKETGPRLVRACQRRFGSFNNAKSKAGLALFIPQGKILPESARKISSEFCYILGVVLGDGFTNLPRCYISLKVKDKNFAENFREKLEEWSNHEAKIYPKNKSGYYYSTLYSKEAVLIVRKFDLTRIIKSSKKESCSFLRGLFDSEGHVAGSNLENPRRASRHIGFYNSNKEVTNIVSILLTKLGVSHSVNSRVHSGFGSKKMQYEIIICGFENYVFFYKNIGFSIKRKQKKLETIINSYVKKSIKLN